MRKAGYLTERREYCNKKTAPTPPKTDHIIMHEDDAYNASVSTDIANTDIEIKVNPDLTEQEAWRLISMIITSYFDIIEVSDRETGYLRTSWKTNSYTQNTVRTRVIIKLGSTNPMMYKVKIVSEQSGYANTSVKQDERFKEWDRVLKKFEGLIPKKQTRLK